MISRPLVSDLREQLERIRLWERDSPSAWSTEAVILQRRLIDVVLLAEVDERRRVNGDAQ